MNCDKCGRKIRHDPKYGDMDKVKKFFICGVRPKLKLKPNSKPKWCIYNKKKV